MKNKLGRVIFALLTLVIIGCAIYVGVGKKQVENKMWDYLTQESYSKSDIHSLKVKHSFANIILSYNEWIIEVVYEDELTSRYHYTLREGKVVESGVSGTTDKEDLKH